MVVSQINGQFEKEAEEADDAPLLLGASSPVSPMYTSVTPGSSYTPSSFGRTTPSFNEDAITAVSFGLCSRHMNTVPRPRLMYVALLRPRGSI